MFPRHVSFGAMILQRRFVYVMDKHKPRPRMYKCAGGRQDGDELPLLTVVREFLEELGLRSKPVDEVRRLRLPGRGGEHDFIGYLMNMVSGEEERIVPGEEILLASFLTLVQTVELLKSDRILPNHAEIMKWWKEFLSPRDIRVLKHPEEPEMEIHIYRSDEAGVLLSSLGPNERIFEEEDGLGLKTRIWHAHVLPETAEKIREYLIREDEKEMDALRAKREAERRSRPREPDDDYLYGRKTPVRTRFDVSPPKTRDPSLPPSYLRTYQTREWKFFKFSAGDSNSPPISTEPTGFMVCDSQSETAKRVGDSKARFYWNEELAAAGLDPTSDGNLKKLSADWRDHKAGSLVMVVSGKFEIDKASITYAVEVKDTEPAQI